MRHLRNEVNNVDQSNWRVRFSKPKTLEVLAKISIAIGLLALLSSLLLYGLEENIYETIDQRSVANQMAYRIGLINKDYYLSQLKRTTFLKVSIHLGWMIGLLCCGFVIPTNIILLLGLKRSSSCLICYWLISTMAFNIATIFGACGAFVLATMLLDLICEIVFMVIGLVFFMLPSFFLWYLVNQLHKRIKQEQLFQGIYSIVRDDDNSRMIRKDLVINDFSD